MMWNDWVLLAVVSTDILLYFKLLKRIERIESRWGEPELIRSVNAAHEALELQQKFNRCIEGDISRLEERFERMGLSPYRGPTPTGSNTTEEA